MTLRLIASTLVLVLAACTDGPRAPASDGRDASADSDIGAHEDAVDSGDAADTAPEDGVDPGECGACPDGFTCNADGACVGDLDEVVIDVPAVPVSGSLTLFGEPAVVQGQCDPAEGLGTVKFVALGPTNEGYVSMQLPCDGGPFEGVLVPGSYNYEVYSRDLGLEDEVVQLGTVVVDTARTIDIDLTWVRVAVTVTRNGLPYSTSASCSNGGNLDAALLTFVDITRGNTVLAWLPCTSGPGEIDIPPGTYDITIIAAFTDLPDALDAVARREITSATTTLELDLPTLKINGRVTHNGARFGTSSECWRYSDGAGFVTFKDVATGMSYREGIPCNPNFDYEVQIPPGTYDVSVHGFDSSQLPPITTSVRRVTLAADASLDLDVVTGTLTGLIGFEGELFEPAEDCNWLNGAGRLAILPLATGERVTYTLPCDEIGSYKVSLPEGSYEVWLEAIKTPRGDYTGPHVTVEVDGLTPLDFSIFIVLPETTRVTGRAHVNGAAATPSDTCGLGLYRMGRVFFVATSDGREFEARIDCTTRTYAVDLPHGEYVVSLVGAGSDIPPIEVDVGTHRVDGPELVLDVETTSTTVRGEVLVNGESLEPSGACLDDGVGGWVRFERLDSEGVQRAYPAISHDFELPCSGLFTARLVPGTYAVRTTGRTSGALPHITTTVIAHLLVE